MRYAEKVTEREDLLEGRTYRFQQNGILGPQTTRLPGSRLIYDPSQLRPLPVGMMSDQWVRFPAWSFSSYWCSIVTTVSP